MFSEINLSIDSAISSGAKYADARILISKSRNIAAKNGEIGDVEWMLLTMPLCDKQNYFYIIWHLVNNLNGNNKEWWFWSKRKEKIWKLNTICKIWVLV